MLHVLIGIKKSVEETISSSGFRSVTYLRLAYFMVNFLELHINNYTDIIGKSTWITSLTPKTPLGLIDHQDIGEIAVAAFKDPDRLNGRAIGLVSDFLSSQQTCDASETPWGRKSRRVT